VPVGPTDPSEEPANTSESIAALASAADLDAECAAEIIEQFAYEGDLAKFPISSASPSKAAQESWTELLAVWSALIDLGVPRTALVLSLSTVRGLSYYTGCVFETVVIGMEDFGSVASGGRFTDLVGTFSKLDLPGVGGSIGLTRLFDMACRSGLVDLQSRSESDVFVGFRRAELKPTARRVAAALRDAGAKVDLYSANGAFKRQLGYADRKRIRTAVLVMADESIIVRRMISGTQVDVKSVGEAVVHAIHTIGGG
jgi:histidyl-tRNA synthetase